MNADLPYDIASSSSKLKTRLQKDLDLSKKMLNSEAAAAPHTVGGATMYGQFYHEANDDDDQQPY